jgi:hypothetical protein
LLILFLRRSRLPDDFGFCQCFAPYPDVESDLCSKFKNLEAITYRIDNEDEGKADARIKQTSDGRGGRPCSDEVLREMVMMSKFSV